MKRTARWFASTSGARSRGKKQPAEPNIKLVRRELIPKGEGKPHWLLWFAVNLMELLFLVVGLSMFLVSGFSLEVNPLLLYGGLTAICLVFTVFYYDT